MQLSLKVKTIKEAAKAFGPDAEEQLGSAVWQCKRMKGDDRLTIEVDDIDPAMLPKLQAAMKNNDETSTRRVSAIINALADPNNKEVGDLKNFPDMFKAWLKKNGNPWLFSTSIGMAGVAYQPVEVKYEAPNYSRRDRAYCTIDLSYNTKGENKRWQITIYQETLRQTVEAIMRSWNLVLPDEDTLERYERLHKRFIEYSSMQAEQFWVRGEASEKNRDRWWWSSTRLNMQPKGRPTKAVIDFGAGSDGDEEEDRYAYRRMKGDTSRLLMFSELHNEKVKIPTHPVLPMFSLVHHKTVWVNVADMSPYEYEAGLGDRLILPKSHRKLIGALVSNLEVLKMEAEVEGKSRIIRAKASSNIILAKGRAGTGKTMTAEVYSEEIKRPLYEVNSGQLGTDPETIESNLNIVLARSMRLRMPLLINEADVFIKKRGDQMEQNAVVTVFLRLLEYHNGLVFMTTNRAEDVDEAISSRCIAEIQYDTPKEPERRRLWSSLLGEFNCSLSDADIKVAAILFPDTTGRDIQNLVRLTSRYCTATGDSFGLQTLAECAAFKSIKVDPQVAKEKGILQ